MKNLNDPIGNRIRDLPTCSAVPQPHAPLRIGHLYPTFVLLDLGPRGVSATAVLSSSVSSTSPFSTRRLDGSLTTEAHVELRGTALLRATGL
jgi:hypothetical protein